MAFHPMNPLNAEKIMKTLIIALLLTTGCITSPPMNDLPEVEQSEAELEAEAQISADAIISVKQQREAIKQRWSERLKTNAPHDPH